VAYPLNCKCGVACHPVLLLCNVPRAQKDAQGYADSTRDKHSANHVISSKHWGYTHIKEKLKALLFWNGDTADIKEGEATFQAKGECQVFSALSRGIPGVS
jgi:hypothetical protein